MCGICGILNVDAKPVDPGLIDRMCRCLAHRGPDDHGTYTGTGTTQKLAQAHLGLGHRRLSIIDLSAEGRQPMANEDGTVWAVFNGEIYNFKALRQKLVQNGHRFKSHTDTEVILHLYEDHGTDAVHHLNGMFAFALWDAACARLWLCRDRIGIKPLVYHWDGRSLRFASEIKALLQDPAVCRQIDPYALSLYLAFNYIPAPWTIFQGIRKLEPGHSLILEDGKLKLRRYWCLPDKPDPNLSTLPLKEQQAAVCRQLQVLLPDAVAAQMISDVPLGAFLSGGIDSSIVVALMAKASRQSIKTFSIGFADLPLFDETRYARMVARHWRTDHYEFQLTSGGMREVLDDVLDAFDEPFADSSAIPTFVVARQTRRHVTVALSGDGGDELFGGYRSYQALYWKRFYLMIPALLRQAMIEPLLETIPEARDVRIWEYARRAKKLARSAGGDFLSMVLALKEVFPLDLRRRLLVDQWQVQGEEPCLRHTKKTLESFSKDPINRMLYADAADSLPGDMLTKVDWMSMRHGLEVRVPLLDHRVVELAFHIPGTLKLDRGLGKVILKKAFGHLLPAAVLHRRKAGFEVPISRWLRQDLRHLLDQHLSAGNLRRQGIFDPETVGDLIKAHLSKRADTSWMLWNLIVFQRWFENWMA